MIKLIQRKEIDDERWNSIIAASRHETIYPYTWYMDACADQWSGFVWGDYEFVMPFAFRKKYTFKYLYQPFYNQQLGVFSDKLIDNEIVEVFLKFLISNFKIGEYAFNSGNILGEENGIDIINRNNYELDLSDTFEEISKGYSTNTKRNIKKAAREEMKFSDRISVDELIKLKSQNNHEHRSKSHYKRVSDFLNEIIARDKAVIYGIKNGEHILAASLFAFSETRAIYLYSVSSVQGKEKSAMFQLIDTFIRLHAKEKLILDFEGSAISSIARFFAGFGGKPQIYQRVKFESIPSKIKRLGKNG